MDSLAAAKLGLHGQGLLAAALLLVLLALAAALLVRAAVRRSRGRAPMGAGAGAAAGLADGWQGIGGPSFAPRPQTLRIIEPRLPTVPVRSLSANGGRNPFGVPVDFDLPGFLASAKHSFVRLQAAWDRSDLRELSECATEDMFSALSHELRVRARPSQTDVTRLEATLLGIETVGGEHRAAVRFHGLLRINDEDERLDEVWNLSRPVEGAGGWLLAGIQQLN
jgi:predicted lipid-binding transport protein (Tim44 family)